MKKYCPGCKTDKDIYDEFYSVNASYCKSCSREYRRKYHAKNREKENALAMAYYGTTEGRAAYDAAGKRFWINNPDKVKDWNKQWKQNNREKVNTYHREYNQRVDKKKQIARAEVAYAIKTGKITRKPCYVCGRYKCQSHHPDYDKRLWVVWLCSEHHTLVERGLLCLLPKELNRPSIILNLVQPSI